MLLLLVLVVRNQAQTTFAKTAVEGVSRNINILCDLDRQFHPLYWKINELIYDQYNVPQIFTVVGHEALVISDVDRRMDGWRFQCFTVNPSSSDGLTPGFVTILTIIYGTSIHVCSACATWQVLSHASLNHAHMPHAAAIVLRPLLVVLLFLLHLPPLIFVPHGFPHYCII